MRCVLLVLLLILNTIVLKATPSASFAQAARDEVAAVERAFAASMADRDLAAFSTFLADDAVFLNGGDPLRGREAIITYWARWFQENTPAPFSWSPDLVEVNAAGTLGQSNGPVFNPDGHLISRFYSTWRKDPDGKWRIVFDNGYKVCP